MDDLIAFLRARLDEQERHARLVAKDAAYDQEGLWEPELDDPPSGEPSAYVLADVEAKRRIIADCERAITRAKESKHGDDYERWPPWSKLAYRTVWNLAQPFAGHPDYRESPFAAPVIAFMTWLESESGGRDTP